jgi:hypothetical protein
MSTSKRYLHDRLVLLLLTVNTFVALLTSVLILLRLDAGRAGGYIIEYRVNRGLSAFKVGDSTEIIAFIFFVTFILIFNTLLSLRVYHIRRYFSIAILAMSLLLLTLALIVSNALLVLR